jgi:uncharacterized membrane protein YcaP (DUF421 family)
MESLFPDTMPWWEFVLRGAGCYIGLLILLRLNGKRSFGEMSPFDIVVLILVGGALRSAMVGKDDSFLGPFFAVIGVLALDYLLGTLATLSPKFNRLLEGHSALLAKSGAMVPGALRRHRIPEAVFERELRAHEARTVERIDEARLEVTGRITIMKSEPR